MKPPIFFLPVPLDQAVAEMLDHIDRHPFEPTRPPDNYDHARHVVLGGGEYRILFDRILMPDRDALLLSISRVEGGSCRRPELAECAVIRSRLDMLDADPSPTILLSNSLKFHKLVPARARNNCSGGGIAA